MIVKDGKAVGVALENGDELYARTIVSGCDPKVTFQKLLQENDLPNDFVESIRKFKFRGSSGKVNLALDGLPNFTSMVDKNLMEGKRSLCPLVL